MSKGWYGMYLWHKPNQTGNETFIYSKRTKNPFCRSLIKNAESPIIRMAICNPFQEPTYRCKRYFWCAATAAHRYVPVLPILNISDTADLQLNLFAWLDWNPKSEMNGMDRENEKEFVSMCKVLKSMGIIMIVSSPYSPQCTGLSKWMKRSSTDNVQVLMKDGQLDSRYRGEAFYQAGYLHNRTISSVLKLRTLQKSVLAEIFNDCNVPTFGFATYLHRPKPNGHSRLYDTQTAVYT